MIAATVFALIIYFTGAGHMKIVDTHLIYDTKEQCERVGKRAEKLLKLEEGEGYWYECQER